MGQIKNVLWVCFGNTARSALAFGISELLKETKFKRELEDVKFDSAGFVNVFKTAQPEVIEYLKAKGKNLINFRGKAMDEELLKNQDIILVMETMHLKRLRKKFKNVKDIEKKSFLLLEFADERENLNIQDPVNYGPEIQQKVYQAVERGVTKSIEKIIKLNQSNKD
jgi:protein-tyrosine-phosphatase